MLFPKAKLAPLPAKHPIFECGHDIEIVRRSKIARTAKLREAAPELEGLFLPDPATGKPRLAVVFSPHDLGCAWQSRPLGVPCMHHDDDGLKLSANLFVWALTR